MRGIVNVRAELSGYVGTAMHLGPGHPHSYHSPHAEAVRATNTHTAHMRRGRLEGSSDQQRGANQIKMKTIKYTIFKNSFKALIKASVAIGTELWMSLRKTILL